MPSARQVSRFTRGSLSALSQRSNCRRAMLSPVNPDRTCKRAPTAGAEEPALARQTISSPWGSARAVPVAPVMYCARSTNNWSAESSSVSSSPRLPLDLLPTAPAGSAETEEVGPVPVVVPAAFADGNASSGWVDPCMKLTSKTTLRQSRMQEITPKGLTRVSPWRLWLSRARGGSTHREKLATPTTGFGPWGRGASVGRANERAGQ